MQAGLIDILCRAFTEEELGMMLHADFPDLLPELQPLRGKARAQQLVRALEQQGRLGVLVDILHRARPSEADRLADDTAPPPAAPVQTLEAALRAGELSINDGLNRCLQVAEALTVLHEAGTVHGALCPRTIQLLPEGQVRLLGVGQAIPAGQLFYVPFEVQSGAVPGPRADIHALAKVAISVIHQGPLPAQAGHDLIRFVRRLGVDPAVRRVLARAASVPLSEGYANMAVFQAHLRLARAGDADLLLVDQGAPIRMVRVPAGTTVLGGAPLEGIVSRAAAVWQESRWDTPGFRIAATPVTQAQWDAVLGARYPNPSRYPEPQAPVESVPWLMAVRFLNALSKREGRRPAYRIYRDDAVEWHPSADGYRLPTEAEWEYACRAGSRSPFHTGTGDDALDKAGWYAGNTGSAGTMPVGWKAPNALGLYDMHGNVGEWCWDEWSAHPHPLPPQHKQRKKSGARVYRGGGWVLSAVFCAAGTRSHARIGPKSAHDYVGFRIAQSILS